MNDPDEDREGFKALVVAMVVDRTDRDRDFYSVMGRWPEPGEVEYATVEEIEARLREAR